jgi:hypothetical protein
MPGPYRQNNSFLNARAVALLNKMTNWINTLDSNVRLTHEVQAEDVVGLFFLAALGRVAEDHGRYNEYYSEFKLLCEAEIKLIGEAVKIVWDTSSASIYQSHYKSDEAVCVAEFRHLLSIAFEGRERNDWSLINGGIVIKRKLILDEVVPRAISALKRVARRGDMAAIFQRALFLNVSLRNSFFSMLLADADEPCALLRLQKQWLVFPEVLVAAIMSKCLITNPSDFCSLKLILCSYAAPSCPAKHFQDKYLVSVGRMGLVHLCELDPTGLIENITQFGVSKRIFIQDNRWPKALVERSEASFAKYLGGVLKPWAMFSIDSSGRGLSRVVNPHHASVCGYHINELLLLEAAFVGDIKEAKRLTSLFSVNLEVISHICGYTPLMIAMEMGHLDVAECLMDAGANIEAKYRGSNMFFFAINGGVAMLELLSGRIKSNLAFWLNCRNDRNFCPLRYVIHELSEKLQGEVIGWLLKKGARKELLSADDQLLLAKLIQSSTTLTVEALGSCSEDPPPDAVSGAGAGAGAGAGVGGSEVSAASNQAAFFTENEPAGLA